MPSKKAFSLLEVLIVLAITSSFLLVGVLSFKKIQEKSLINGQLSVIMAQLELARSEALAANDDAVIESDGSFFTVIVSGKLPRKVFLGQDFSLQGPKIGFTLNGNTKYAGTLYLYYLNKQRYKIVLAPATGLLRSEPI